jgi:hypothetical protein
MILSSGNIMSYRWRHFTPKQLSNASSPKWATILKQFKIIGAFLWYIAFCSRALTDRISLSSFNGPQNVQWVPCQAVSRSVCNSCRLLECSSRQDTVTRKFYSCRNFHPGRSPRVLFRQTTNWTRCQGLQTNPGAPSDTCYIRHLLCTEVPQRRT